MGVVSIARLAFLEVGGWQQSELQSAAADTTVSLLWAALPLMSKNGSASRHSSLSLHPISPNGSSPSSALAGGCVAGTANRSPSLCRSVSAQGRAVLLRAKCPTGFLRLGPSLGAPRSTEGDPPKKCRQKYVVLASSLVANETNCQPCPNKAFAGGEAVAGEVSLLCLFPFLRTTTLKKSSRQSSLCLSALYNSKKQTCFLCKAAASLASHLFQAPSRVRVAALHGGYCSGADCIK